RRPQGRDPDHHGPCLDHRHRPVHDRPDRPVPGRIPAVSLPYYDADAVHAVLPFERAIRAIEEAVRDDVDPELDGPRLFADAPDGEFLLMPAQSAKFSGLKALTLAPNNPAR